MLKKYEREYSDFLTHLSKNLQKNGITIGEGDVDDVSKAFISSISDMLGESPSFYIKGFGTVSVVILAKRNRVLRGVTYPSSTRYKLKISMDTDLYDTIDRVYSEFIEDDY